jgi:hypothetical protein
LSIRRVRRYRKAAYPSRSRAARHGGTLVDKTLRAAAAPAVALGLGAALGGCDGGTRLEGEGDAGDAVDTVDSPDAVDPWGDMIAGARPDGHRYTVYLTEAEGRALIDEVVGEETVGDTDPCRPALHLRLHEDWGFRLDDTAIPGFDPGLEADRLAPEMRIEIDEAPPCPPGFLPPIGFEFMTEEAGDDQDVSADPRGLTDAEEAVLDEFRTAGTAAIARIRADDFPYEVVDWDGWLDESDKARAESLVRETVRALLADLRRDGFL